MNNEEVKNRKDSNKKIKKYYILISLVAIILISIIIIFVSTSNHGDIKTNIKTTLDSIVEKGDLETASITYNVIAKKCKDDKKCNKDSNDINNFKYVVSCKGTITAGINFENVEIEVTDKKIKIKIPDATIIGIPNIGEIKFINGKEIGADELPNARNLCQETAIEKSKKDDKLIAAAKEQAKVVLEDFYNQWIKTYSSNYTIEIE